MTTFCDGKKIDSKDEVYMMALVVVLVVCCTL